MLAHKTLSSLPYSLGRYQVTGVLGRGAMGVVYRAFDPVIERTVALKTIRVHLDTHEAGQFRERFYREAKAAGGLSHQNIVTIYDAAEDNGVAYIAMELLEGLSLRQIIDARSRLSVARLARIIVEVAEALAYAHDNGVIHRDIKPANIVLTKSGLTKITDFGIAQLPAMSCTQPGLLVGSPRYMSPEQISGAPLDGRSDIFSLGAVLYELLTGRVPFHGENMEELMYSILHTTPLPLSRASNSIPAKLEDVVNKALAKVPHSRFQSAKDFSKELRQFQASPARRVPSYASITQQETIRTPETITLSPTTAPRIKKFAAPLAFLFAVSSVYYIAASPVTLKKVRPATTQAMQNNFQFAMIGTDAPPLPIVNAAEIPALTNKPPSARPPKEKVDHLHELNKQLKLLRSELMDMKTKFTDLYPDVIEKKRHIEMLEQEKLKYEHK